MSAKIDYKKHDKSLYLPKGEPAILDVPPMPFAAIEGEGGSEPPRIRAGDGGAVRAELCRQNVV
ncbi:hypothetical protein OMP38_28635 [Cohnella ginsengisoli]|uniref:Uncharacterized protein n=1 Tax=Cohnella ginsengisoli TaxID=425004 RepID=A0A9X4KLQ5_9BACL|nr:hypothetical protein [Cohnella ginsengisoli]MDG0794363.1 hypothetical protein [Cohnella ginsengisoli]